MMVYNIEFYRYWIKNILSIYRNTIRKINNFNSNIKNYTKKYTWWYRLTDGSSSKSFFVYNDKSVTSNTVTHSKPTVKQIGTQSFLFFVFGLFFSKLNSVNINATIKKIILVVFSKLNTFHIFRILYKSKKG